MWVSFILLSDFHLDVLRGSHPMGVFTRGVAGRRVFIVNTLHATSHRPYPCCLRQFKRKIRSSYGDDYEVTGLSCV